MTGSDEYERSIERLEGLFRRPHVPAAIAGLRRAEFLLERFERPQHTFRSVHVAGTSGKGSTTTYIGSILSEAGHSVGLFRSPHVQSYRERIVVNGQCIDTDAWVRWSDSVVAVAERMEAGSSPGYELGRPTLFEILFTVAACYFRERQIEWAVLEAGMGGRLDATNTVQSQVAVITTVSLEHTRVLGDTVEAIAAEKAAIIKTGSEAVTSAQNERVLQVLHNRALDQAVSLRVLNRDFRVQTLNRAWTGQDVRLWDAKGSLVATLKTGAEPAGQNAAAAFAAARALQQDSVAISDEAIVRGLACDSPPGRFEVVSSRPLVVLDGAQSVGGMESLSRSLLGLLHDRRCVLLFAAMGDKNLHGMARATDGVFQSVVLTTLADSDRAARSSALAEAFSMATARVQVIEDPHDALVCALQLSGEDGVLVVAGSLYLVGWARGYLGRQSPCS